MDAMAEFQEMDVCQETDLSFYQSMSPDWKHNNQEKTPGIWKVLDNEVQGSDPDEGIQFMSLTPRNVSKIIEPGQMYLCITYGPTKKPQYLYLDFSQRSREELDKWAKAVGSILGLKDCTAHHRRNTEAASIRRPINKPVARPKSALANMGRVFETSGERTDFAALTAINENPSPVNDHNGQVTPPESNEIVSTDASRSGRRDYDDMSPPGSLHSDDGAIESMVANRLKSLQEERDQRDGVEQDFETKILSEMDVRLGDIQDGVYVSSINETSMPCHDLYIGDLILEVDSHPVKDARHALQIIMQKTGEKVKLKLRRFPNGNICVINPAEKSWPQLGISVEGNKITRMEPGYAFRASCDPSRAMFGQNSCAKAITSINDRPVPLSEQTDEVVNRILDACAEDLDGPLVFHVHPIAFLMALSSDQVPNQARRRVPGANRGQQLDGNPTST